ncbi:DUF861 domain-containing protein [Paraburkholderia sp. Ac-20340]|uniref:cupin domain-containing protein n=1 Tax=Paraburkholderia sp. Ac-20340 TaxID=2703888 RepID=UPI00197EFDF7|nr:cupin domain-containing protein [Paraburkholderia sp. Ac-20340]MBN3851946.1 DUF861 domain-containing protein [Paraburkholderia sp. Ac-20340]
MIDAAAPYSESTFHDIRRSQGDTMPVAFITPLNPLPGHAPQVSPTVPAALISGNGDTRSWPAFHSVDGVVSSGVWESEAFCKRKAHPDSMEFCFILEGAVALTDQHGNTASFGPGEAFIVEPGFDGTWESLTRVRKYFVIAKCAAAAVPADQPRARDEQVC